MKLIYRGEEVVKMLKRVLVMDGVLSRRAAQAMYPAWTKNNKRDECNLTLRTPDEMKPGKVKSKRGG